MKKYTNPVGFQIGSVIHIRAEAPASFIAKTREKFPNSELCLNCTCNIDWALKDLKK